MRTKTGMLLIGDNACRGYMTRLNQPKPATKTRDKQPLIVAHQLILRRYKPLKLVSCAQCAIMNSSLDYERDPTTVVGLNRVPADKRSCLTATI
jgi:hypothetical protein